MISNMAPEREPWIGTLEVVPREWSDVYGEWGGAFVVVVALARSLVEFEERTAGMMAVEGFDVLEYTEVDKWSDRLQSGHASDEVRGLIPELSEDWPVLWATFHAYPPDAKE